MYQARTVHVDVRPDYTRGLTVASKRARRPEPYGTDQWCHLVLPLVPWYHMVHVYVRTMARVWQYTYGRLGTRKKDLLARSYGQLAIAILR